jgi:hypothetical protein
MEAKRSFIQMRKGLQGWQQGWQLLYNSYDLQAISG